MPDHLHWLMQLQTESLSAVVALTKGRSARLCAAGGLWQAAFYDHQLRRHETLMDVTRYILRNPITAGLVTDLRDYPYWNTCFTDVVCPETGRLL